MESVERLPCVSPYLCNTTNVLFPVLWRESKVFVQAETDIVAVKSVCLQTEVEQMLLESCCNGRLARGGETGKPYSGSLLLAELTTLLAGQTLVPSDVAIEC